MAGREPALSRGPGGDKLKDGGRLPSVPDAAVMIEPTGLRHGSIPATAAHLCVDMQRLFADATEWNTPWMRRVLPQVVRLCERDPSRTCFTRFIPVREPGEGAGTWRRYYEHWRSMTLEALDPPDLVGLLPELALFSPPALVFDKQTYSPWHDGRLHGLLGARGVDTLVISGGETDVCVLATVMSALDLGYRIVLATDALCSASDRTHEALLLLYRERFSQQIATATTEEVLQAWN
jgi:nicotinamidase-related amidase